MLVLVCVYSNVEVVGSCNAEFNGPCHSVRSQTALVENQQQQNHSAGVSTRRPATDSLTFIGRTTAGNTHTDPHSTTAWYY